MSLDAFMAKMKQPDKAKGKKKKNRRDHPAVLAMMKNPPKKC